MATINNSDNSVRNHLPVQIATGVAIVASISGMGCQIYNMISDTENKYANYGAVSSFAAIFASSLFALFKGLKGSSHDGYTSLKAVEVEHAPDVEKLSNKVDQFFLALRSNELPSILSSKEFSLEDQTQLLEKLKLIEAHLDNLRKSPPSPAKVEPACVESASGEFPALKEALESLETAKAEIIQLKTQLTDLHSQKTVAEKKLQTSEVVTQKYIAEKTALQRENIKMATELKTAKNQLEEEQDDVVRLESTITDLQSQTARLQEQIEKLDLQFKDLIDVDGQEMPAKLKQLGQTLDRVKSLSATASASASASSPATPVKRSFSITGSNGNKDKHE